MSVKVTRLSRLWRNNSGLAIRNVPNDCELNAEFRDGVASSLRKLFRWKPTSSIVALTTKKVVTLGRNNFANENVRAAKQTALWADFRRRVEADSRNALVRRSGTKGRGLDYQRHSKRRSGNCPGLR